MKLVKESLNEIISFERKKDPLSTLGIGRKQMIKKWLKYVGIDNKKYKYEINEDLTIDGKMDLYLNPGLHLIKFPDFIQFNKVNGNFSCYLCGLKSLKGCPKYVKKSFSCSYNKLEFLKGCPKYVGRDFICWGNEKQFTAEDVRLLCDVKHSIMTIGNP